MKIVLKTLVLASLLPATSHAWGGRGHHTICDAASFLTQEKGLHDYLQAKAYIMGYLCNIPDTYWRDISAEVSKIGGPAHFIDAELLGLQIKDIPLDYKSIIKTYTGKENPIKPGSTIKSVPSEFGSNWWRADQFYRRATAIAEKWKATTPPANSLEEQNDNFEFNKYANEFMINLGLMGHFVADNGQPFHSTIDYDGWIAGHGGIHAYYEENLVAFLPENLNQLIIQEARKMRKNASKQEFLNKASVLENMRALSIITLREKDEIYKIDKLIKKSEIKEEKSMSLKTPAVREPAEKMVKKFQPLLVRNMARSAALLAKIWDDAYIAAGKPKLTAHKSYSFPHKPDFVAPDYLE